MDITSFSPPSSIPSVSPPPVTDTPASPVKAPPVPVSPQLPNSNVNVKPGKASKKRKASDADIAPPQRPEVIPPKPSFTYAQLCYRAIKTLGGKGTLQDILTWIKENYDWYRWTEDKAWEVGYPSYSFLAAGGLNFPMYRNLYGITCPRIARSQSKSVPLANAARATTGRSQRTANAHLRSRRLEHLRAPLVPLRRGRLAGRNPRAELRLSSPL